MTGGPSLSSQVKTTPSVAAEGVGGAEMSKNRTWPREGSFGDAGTHSASRYRLSS